MKATPSLSSVWGMHLYLVPNVIPVPRWLLKPRAGDSGWLLVRLPNAPEVIKFFRVFEKLPPFVIHVFQRPRLPLCFDELGNHLR